MADLPELEQIQENQAIGEEYEHPEPDSPADGCSNLGEMPDDLDDSDTEDDGEDDGNGGIK